jgi:serine protease Do
MEEAAAPTTGTGLSLRALSDTERQELNLPQGGVRVTGVGFGSALRAGFRPGDVVLSLDGVTVTDPAQFRQLMRQLPHDRPVPVLVQRPGTHLFLPLDVTPR